MNLARVVGVRAVGVLVLASLHVLEKRGLRVLDQLPEFARAGSEIVSGLLLLFDPAASHVQAGAETT